MTCNPYSVWVPRLPYMASVYEQGGFSGGPDPGISVIDVMSYGVGKLASVRV